MSVLLSFYNLDQKYNMDSFKDALVIKSAFCVYNSLKWVDTLTLVQ